MDLIYAGRYTEVCDYAWHDFSDNKLDLPAGIWHVDTASIPEFFQRISTGLNQTRNYVVVSPSCDFGVCLQEYNHPALDFEKWVGLQATVGHGYRDLNMPARINRKRCRESDKYSIKCWSYTEATFNVIPSNVVRWFLVNCEIEDERITPIPFGIFGNKKQQEQALRIDACRNLLEEYPPRDKLLYINFQFYTTDRYRLYVHFNQFFNSMVTCKQKCSFNEYLEDLATHKFVLCPTGNGLDCYRTLESIYMGAIPILENRRGALAPYQGLEYPILTYANLFQVNPHELPMIYEEIMETYRETDLTRVLWPYWKNEIEKYR